MCAWEAVRQCPLVPPLLRKPHNCRPQAAEESTPRKHHGLMAYGWGTSLGNSCCQILHPEQSGSWVSPRAAVRMVEFSAPTALTTWAAKWQFQSRMKHYKRVTVAVLKKCVFKLDTSSQMLPKSGLKWMTYFCGYRAYDFLREKWQINANFPLS